jgi:acyl-coenzyme A synthetase/AMP-(fatty) acid ligase
VIGSIDPIRGEVPIAYVVTREHFDPADIEARCRTRMASFKVPRKFVTVAAL